MPGERTFLKVPDFQYAADYYPQIAARLRQRARANVPEITNEDSREPFIQAERSSALASHFNNVLLDMVANGLYLKTATLPESVKLILELINAQLLPAGPAQVDIVGQLVSSFSSVQRLLEPYRKFATKRNPDIPELVFENTEALDLSIRTDQIAYSYGMQYQKEGNPATTVLSSVESDVVETDSADYFSADDLNHYMSIRGSNLGNDVDDLRIIELFNEVGSFDPKHYTKARLQGASFVSEANAPKWILRYVTNNTASDWNSATLNNPLGLGPLQPGDKVYLGHPEIMFDRIDVVLDSTPSPPAYEGLWEFYDPSDSTVNPDEITLQTSTMDFEITSLIGTANAAGAIIEVLHIPSNTIRRGESWYGGGPSINQVTTDFMGQVDPSTSPDDYTVTAYWRPVTIREDGTIQAGSDASWSQNGMITIDLPQTRSNSWLPYNLYDHTLEELQSCFFLRYRVVVGGSAAFPDPVTVQQHNGNQYIVFRGVQGQTVEENPIGSSTGESKQQFTLTRTPYVLNSARIFVDEGGGEYEWLVRTSLTSSLSEDRHCMVDPQSDGTAIVGFGDGVNGRIPPIGTNNIRSVFRIGADMNGNIGASTLTVNRDGVGVFKNIWNPRQGQFWIAADWSSQEALERAKVRGPRVLRTLKRAISATDCEILASSFVNVNGVRPIARARAYEESFGPKTIELVVTGGGGAAISANNAEEIQEYFNGGSVYGYGGVLMVNHELTVTNYSPKLIGIDIRVAAFPVVTESLVLQILASLINPTALENDGRSYVWRYGQNVPLSRIVSEVFLLAPGNIFDVDITSPFEDVQLTARELPMIDVANTNIVIVPPSFTTA
jgi:hypothetical protein